MRNIRRLHFTNRTPLGIKKKKSRRIRFLLWGTHRYMPFFFAYLWRNVQPGGKALYPLRTYTILVSFECFLQYRTTIFCRYQPHTQDQASEQCHLWFLTMFETSYCWSVSVLRFSPKTRSRMTENNCRQDGWRLWESSLVSVSTQHFAENRADSLHTAGFKTILYLPHQHKCARLLAVNCPLWHFDKSGGLRWRGSFCRIKCDNTFLSLWLLHLTPMLLLTCSAPYLWPTPDACSCNKAQLLRI